MINIGDRIRVISDSVFDGNLYGCTGIVVGIRDFVGCEGYLVDFKESINKIGERYMARLHNANGKLKYNTGYHMFEIEIEVIEHINGNKNFKLKTGE